MKRYLFLDIDGVCNHDDWYNHNRFVKKNWKCGDYDPHVIELLNQLADLDVKVVISSSWGTLADKPLLDLGLKLPIVGHTEQLSPYCEWLCRGNEIAKWLDLNVIQEHIDDTYEYVIFDDVQNMLMSQAENFVYVDKAHGLTQEHIDKARVILSGGNMKLDVYEG